MLSFLNSDDFCSQLSIIVLFLMNILEDIPQDVSGRGNLGELLSLPICFTSSIISTDT